MKYSIEQMKKISAEFAEMIKTAVIEQEKTEGKHEGIAEIERGMREGLRQIGQASLGEVLSGLQATPDAGIACKCGGN